MTIDADINIVADKFAEELRALHRQMDWNDYITSSIKLEVTVTNSSAKFALYCSPGPYEDHLNVKGAQLDDLLKEIRRRLDYNHRTEGALTTDLLLPAPQQPLSEESDIPF